MKFKVGDLVWAHTGANASPGLSPHSKYAAEIVGKSWGTFWEIAIDGHPCSSADAYWDCEERWLSPRKPPDEIKREELGSWDLCPWQPKEVRV